jgi:SAM-dependent methyltransferase
MKNSVSKDQIRQNVRNRYKQIAIQSMDVQSCCNSSSSSKISADDASSQMGYSAEELSAAPDGANLGLGCGNPQAIASLKIGEAVLDLGSGGGFDCFLASKQVGEEGRVIGVDMTPEMVSRARLNAEKNGYSNTEFRLGEIENLPLPDRSVDVIISNCVINLSPDKQRVMDEAFRVLKSGGRLAISDIVMTAELPNLIKDDLDELYSGCISGASSIEGLRQMLTRSGFHNITIEPKDESINFIIDWVHGQQIENHIIAAVIKGTKC